MRNKMVDVKPNRKSEGNKAFHITNYIFLGLILLLVAYPLYFIVIASISAPNLVNTGQITLIPRGITFEGYKSVFADDSIMTGYKNSLIYTTLGILCSVVTTVLAAYALSVKTLPGRRLWMLLIVFTMYFSGGMIPTYLVVNKLGLTNTIWSLIIPSLVVPYNLIIARSFFESSIPGELHEAAMLDGCNEYDFFKKVALPLSKAIIAIMVLFYGVAQWNTYFNAMLYIKDQALYPLQLVLRNILVENQVSAEMVGDTVAAAARAEKAELIKYVSIIVSIVPLMIMYPFVQKHFVKGVLIGSVKG